MRTVRAGRQGLQAVDVEVVDRVAHGLVVAVQVAGNVDGFLARGTGQQDLAAAQSESVGRAQSGQERRLFVGLGSADKDWFSHVHYYTTSPTVQSAFALGLRLDQTLDVSGASLSQASQPARGR